MFHQKALFHSSIQKLQRNASLASSPILGHALGKESSTSRDPSKLWRLSRRHLAKYFAPP
jgi:hypothetical protein